MLDLQEKLITTARVLVTALVALFAVTPSTPADSRAEAKELRALVTKAKKLDKEKKYRSALEAIQQVHSVLPEEPTVKRMVVRLARKLAGRRADEAEAIFKKKEPKKNEKKKAIHRLRQCFELEPLLGRRAKALKRAASLFKKQSYRHYRGAWRTEKQIKSFDVKDRKRENQFYERLNLDASFRIVRTEHFRIFTNMPKGREWDKWLAPVLRVIESYFEKYQWVFMGEVDLDDVDRGITVVFFKNEEDYREYLNRNNIAFSFQTAGFYSPDKKSCFFYRHPNHGSIWSTMLHELTHELNDQILHSASVSWINEGLAEYFASAIVNKDYTLTVGRPNHYRLSYLRSQGLGEQYIPAERLFKARSVDEAKLFPEQSIRHVYSFAWGWAYFLLHNELKHRRLLFDAIGKEREFWQKKRWEQGKTPQDVYKEVFEEYGFSIADIDGTFIDFIRNVTMTARKRR